MRNKTLNNNSAGTPAAGITNHNHCDVWFKIKHDELRGYVLGREIDLDPSLDFPVTFPINKPVVILQDKGVPVVCTITGIDELSQKVKIQTFLERAKPNTWIDVKSISRLFGAIWYCGTGKVAQPEQVRVKQILAENNIRFVCA